jgi:5-formyltetrahydrofolate cyclo-ligase
MDPGIVGQKASIRAWVKSRPRPSLEESRRVGDHLAEWLGSLPPADVLLYLAMPGELNVDVLERRLAHRHRFHVTRTPPSGPLTVHAWNSPLERHAFGFWQPDPTAPEVDPGIIDVVLVPGLAFDRHGGRLGHGKGYYDQLLTRTSRASAIVGVTLERFLLAEIPVESHDHAMTHIATERGVNPVFD